MILWLALFLSLLGLLVARQFRDRAVEGDVLEATDRVVVEVYPEGEGYFASICVGEEVLGRTPIVEKAWQADLEGFEWIERFGVALERRGRAHAVRRC